MAAKNKSNELKLTRVYDAPVKLVWDAWTDPKKVAKWWGPRGFTITTHSKDLRPGGHWTYTMHGPDGATFENKTLYLEVEKYSKLVYDHGGNEDLDRPPLFRVTVLFSESKGKTKMEMTMAFESPERAREISKLIKQANGNSTWDRLAEYLDKETENKDIFVINRTFNAPIDVLFKMWTDPNHFAKWLPPTGMNMTWLRPGFYVMFNNEGSKFYGKINYQKIQEPDLIIYTQQFCDEKENLISAPMMKHWPETMLSTVKLAAESEDQTRVTVTWEPQPPVSPEALAEFINMRSSMTMGWTGSFDKLEDLLGAL